MGIDVVAQDKVSLLTLLNQTTGHRFAKKFTQDRYAKRFSSRSRAVSGLNPQTGNIRSHKVLQQISVIGGNFDDETILIERKALARLSVLAGGFSPEAARAVAGAPLPVLGALADKSLLRKEQARLHLHPLVQQLAAERLEHTTNDRVD